MLPRVGTSFRYVLLPRSTKYIPWRIVGWSSTIHKVWSDRSPTSRATAPLLGMIVHSNGMYVAIYCHELGTLSVRVALAKYENIPCGIAGWSSKIHKVGSDTSPTARATVPQLGMVVHSTGMYVAIYCHELGTLSLRVALAKYENIYLG
jgi:hypothetical protein